MKKRSDLQGIRGIAILSVLLYHFFPDIFKNGYVGVDQFFILSGFLMAEILSRESSISLASLQGFYYRRMKRILPLYALFIFVTLSITPMVFEFPFFTYNVPYALRSLAFISNTNMENDILTYKEMLANAQVLFTHTWSLSCEVQFYVIAPILILMPLTCGKIAVLSLIGFLSYVSFTYLLDHGKQEFAFNSMLTRIWQFLAGCLCSLLHHENTPPTIECDLLLSKDNNSTLDFDVSKQKKDNYFTTLLSNVVCFSMLICCLFPIEITPHFVRLLVCVQTTVLIFSGTEFPNYLLSNRYIVYLGDISYTLYLIHWPACVFLKQYQFNALFASCLGILGCILLAALVFETYEKFYLKLEKKGIIVLTSSLYVGCVILILAISSQSILKQQEVVSVMPYITIPENVTVEEAIDWNNKFSAMDETLINMKDCAVPPWAKLCTFNDTNFTGSKRLMLIGNSFAATIARMFIRLKECQMKAQEIQMYTRYGCEVLEHTAEYCNNVTEDYQAVVANVKPDILFIMTRHMTPVKSVEGPEDTILKTEKELLQRIEMNVKDKVYILNAVPEHNYNIISAVNNGLKSGKKPSQESLRGSSDYALARKRMYILSKSCSKCEMVDVTPAFTKNGTYQFYNEENGLLYIIHNQHFSEYGLQTMAYIYNNVCSNMA